MRAGLTQSFFERLVILGIRPFLCKCSIAWVLVSSSLPHTCSSAARYRSAPLLRSVFARVSISHGPPQVSCLPISTSRYHTLRFLHRQLYTIKWVSSGLVTRIL
ncbi:uncharacterized protein BJ212DRAFT_1312825, partial [Suillus subaureus]